MELTRIVYTVSTLHWVHFFWSVRQYHQRCKFPSPWQSAPMDTVPVGDDEAVKAECFLCWDDTPEQVRRFCACNMCCHTSCFVRLVQNVSSHQHQCPICKHVYNMRVRTSYRVVVNTPLWLLYTIGFVAQCLAVFLYKCPREWLNDTDEVIDFWRKFTMFGAVGMTCSAPLVHFWALRTRRPTYCVKCIPRVQKVLHVQSYDVSSAHQVQIHVS